MKHSFFTLLALTLIHLTTTVEAAPYSGFCWAQKTSGVYCSAIAFSPSYYLQGLICKQYAATIGSSQSGFYRNTDVSALKEKQDEGCNYVADLPKYTCLLQERCETPDGVTSSISPLGHSVFSASSDEETAKKMCISTHSAPYLNALSNATSDCLIGARAVMTIPKKP
jgi:hypothetical protein